MVFPIKTLHRRCCGAWQPCAKDRKSIWMPQNMQATLSRPKCRILWGSGQGEGVAMGGVSQHTGSQHSNLSPPATFMFPAAKPVACTPHPPVSSQKVRLGKANARLCTRCEAASAFAFVVVAPPAGQWWHTGSPLTLLLPG